MNPLRAAKELLPYFLVCCCGLLFAAIYFFHWDNLPTWALSSTISNSTSFSISFHDSQKTIEHVPSAETNTHLLEGNSTSLQKPTVGDSRINITNGNIDKNLQILAGILQQKLQAINIDRLKNYKPTCNSDFKLANSCDNSKCLQTELPENITMRVTQLVTPSKLQMSHDEHEILREMTDKVNGTYDIILLSAASSNHFLETQAFFKNIHQKILPYLKNFTLIFYNLGLTEPERNLMVKYCRCQVIDFPFHKFPKFMSNLMCYSWKPVLIKANLQKANIVFWMDSSIRLYNFSAMYEYTQTARERGVQIGGPEGDSSFRTSRSMYHFFGDEPCAYLKLYQAYATLGVYHREYFVDRVILEPWVACAVKEDCMCPRHDSILNCGNSISVAAKYYAGKSQIVYGLCHRFDQSGISLILHKLYQDLYKWVMVPTGSWLSISRGDKAQYFPKE